MRDGWVDKAAMDYAVKMTSPTFWKHLNKIERETYQKVLNPRMLSGGYQGNLLTLLSLIIQPNFVLEIGTYVGYSAICLAQGLSPRAKLTTIERREEYFYKAKLNIQQSPFAPQINLIHGDAISVIPKIDQLIDIAFIDGDKREYVTYLKALLPKMRKGGVIISDNVLLDGKVFNTRYKDEDTLAIRAFNNKIFEQQDRLYSVLLPLRDGLFLSVVR